MNPYSGAVGTFSRQANSSADALTYGKCEATLRICGRIRPGLSINPRIFLGISHLTPKPLVGSGKQVRLELDEGLQHAVSSVCMQDLKRITIQLFVDGLTSFRGSKLQLRPISDRILNPLSQIFVVGPYSGMKNLRTWRSPQQTSLRIMNATNRRELYSTDW
ncbi:hypothetical protein FGIG_05196 [Fasciola gigantica]|uniref:Uncharacterized protein n=1 Tax=Fasciola gigantica TaxID=46835 RepID=A0A504YF91_FASGI|nr:hypothetical protein FGIG_05195 [Fasciola gigantica]TPP58889.1 hypothetical protein FGIG_05196 [Fasciola gigantica]